MSHHVSAGDRIFSDWSCECGHEFSTNRHADVDVVRCPRCRHAYSMEPIKAELDRARRDAREDLDETNSL